MPINPISTIQSTRLRAIVAYLDSKRPSNRPLVRSDIDPITEIPRLVPYTMLVERTPERRHRVRLVGTKVVEIIGYDFTGKWLDDLGMGPAADWFGEVEAVFASTETLAGRVRLPWHQRSHISIEWIAQKLTAVDGTVDLSFVGLDRAKD
jgi:hypothetical protein